MVIRYEESPIFLNYKGVKIYSVFKNDLESAGVREYIFGTDPYVTDQGPYYEKTQPFDIREIKGYNSKLSTKKNLQNMIDNGIFDDFKEETPEKKKREYKIRISENLLGEFAMLETPEGNYEISAGDAEYNGLNIDFRPKNGKFAVPLVTMECPLKKKLESHATKTNAVNILIYGDTNNGEPTYKTYLTTKELKEASNRID